MIPSLLMCGALLCPTPTAFVIDCGTWIPGTPVEFRFRVTAADGSASANRMLVEPEADADGVRFSLEANLKLDGWKVRQLSDTQFIVEGFKGSPVRSVEFTSKVWAPTATPLYTRTAVPPPTDKQ